MSDTTTTCRIDEIHDRGDAMAEALRRYRHWLDAGCGEDCEVEDGGFRGVAGTHVLRLGEGEPRAVRQIVEAEHDGEIDVYVDALRLEEDGGGAARWAILLRGEAHVGEWEQAAREGVGGETVVDDYDQCDGGTY